MVEVNAVFLLFFGILSFNPERIVDGDGACAQFILLMQLLA